MYSKYLCLKDILHVKIVNTYKNTYEYNVLKRTVVDCGGYPQLAPLAIVLPSRPASANESPGKEVEWIYCIGRSAGTLPENFGIRART